MSVGGSRRARCGASCHAVMLSALALALSVRAAPRLVVPPEGIAFGEIPAGTNVSNTVELRNVGSVPVHISRVKACCGATAELAPRAISPDGVAILTVSLEARDVGPFSKTISLSCDDPERPLLSVPVTGTVVNASGREVRLSRHEIYSFSVLALGIVLSIATFADFMWRTSCETHARTRFRKCLAYAVRFGIGGVFVFAGCAKLGDLDAFAELVARYDMLPSVFVLPFAHALPVTEILFGTMFAFTRWMRLAAVMVAVMLLAFIVALAQAAIHGLDVSCGCFGGPANGTHTELLFAIVRDMLLILPVIWLAVRGGTAFVRPSAHSGNVL